MCSCKCSSYATFFISVVIVLSIVVAVTHAVLIVVSSVVSVLRVVTVIVRAVVNVPDMQYSS